MFVFHVSQNALKERDYESAEELQAVINKLTISIQRLQAKLQGTEPPPEEPEVKSIEPTCTKCYLSHKQAFKQASLFLTFCAH